MDVHELPRPGKKKWQWAADLAGAYGSASLGRIDHECRVGLWLCRERIGLQRSWDVFQGTRTAADGVIPFEMFEAISECREEAELNFWRQSVNQRFNAARTQ